MPFLLIVIDFVLIPNLPFHYTLHITWSWQWSEFKWWKSSAESWSSNLNDNIYSLQCCFYCSWKLCKWLDLKSHSSMMDFSYLISCQFNFILLFFFLTKGITYKWIKCLFFFKFISFFCNIVNSSIDIAWFGCW